MEEFAKYMEKFARAEQQRKDESMTNLRSNILPALARAGVVSVVAEYSGYGDSGAIDSIEYLDAHRKPVTLTGDAACVTGLEDAIYEFLPAGFEINDGGQGTLTLHVLDSKAVLQHGENVVEVNESTQEYDL